MKNSSLVILKALFLICGGISLNTYCFAVSSLPSATVGGANLLQQINKNSSQNASSITGTSKGAVSTVPYVQTIVMHRTNASQLASSYIPTCFPTPSPATYTESVMDTLLVGSYGTNPAAGTLYYRCLRISTPTAAANFGGWQTNPLNPNNSNEQITTSYPTYSSVFSNISPTTFVQSCTTQGSYSFGYQQYGFTVTYNDGNGQSQSTSGGHWSSSGGNCNTSTVQTSAQIPPGWITVNVSWWINDHNGNTTCNNNNFRYYLSPATVGKTCNLNVSTDNGHGGDGSQGANCGVNIICN